MDEPSEPPAEKPRVLSPTSLKAFAALAQTAESMNQRANVITAKHVEQMIAPFIEAQRKMVSRHLAVNTVSPTFGQIKQMVDNQAALVAARSLEPMIRQMNEAMRPLLAQQVAMENLQKFLLAQNQLTAQVVSRSLKLAVQANESAKVSKVVEKQPMTASQIAKLLIGIAGSYMGAWSFLQQNLETTGDRKILETHMLALLITAFVLLMLAAAQD